jgi:hypothetical protein
LSILLAIPLDCARSLCALNRFESPTFSGKFLAFWRENLRRHQYSFARLVSLRSRLRVQRGSDERPLRPSNSRPDGPTYRGVSPSERSTVAKVCRQW